MPRAALISIALTATLFACSEQTSPSPSGGAGEGTEGTSAAQGQEGTQSSSEGCAPGATTNTEGGFCIDVPSDHHAVATKAESDAERRFAFENGASSIVVVVRTGVGADAFANAKHGLESEAASLSGRTRSFGDSIASTWKEADGRTVSSAILKSGDRILECRATSTGAPALQSCLTMRSL